MFRSKPGAPAGGAEDTEEIIGKLHFAQFVNMMVVDQF
jgi:hypothetical protein